jgi:hypothetical protein
VLEYGDYCVRVGQLTELAGGVLRVSRSDFEGLMSFAEAHLLGWNFDLPLLFVFFGGKIT